MRLIALLPLVLSACTSLAHAAELTVQTREITGKNARGEAYASGQMTTPLVKPRQANDPMAAKVAKKINDRLAFMDLDGTESQQFTVSRNDARILTIAFEIEGCGAYCENYNTWTSFDLQDGSLLTPANLFTPNGMRALAKRLRQEQITRYRGQLKALAKDLKTAQARPIDPASKKGGTKQDLINDVEDRIALNQGCLDDQLAKEKAPAGQAGHGLFDYAGSLPFEITEDTFQLTADRCSNHAMRALDDVGNVVLSLPFRDLQPWLTAYGKSVLLGEGSAPPAERVYSQVLHGTLGAGTAITMLIDKDRYGNVNGRYFYDRRRLPIELTGGQTGPTIDLKEFIDGKPQTPANDGTFSLTKTGNVLRGQWASKAANKQFDVRLAP